MGLERSSSRPLAHRLFGARGFRWAFAGAAAATLGLLGTAASLVGLARSGDCGVRSHQPLSMAQLIDVRQRFDAYRADPASGLLLTGEELSMLLEDRADVPVYVDVRGPHLSAQVALPASAGRCWPVDFEGELTVMDGIATVVPQRLAIGDLNLSALTRGVHIQLLPEHMPSARAASFLRQTRSARLSSGQMQVELTEPASFTWRGIP